MRRALARQSQKLHSDPGTTLPREAKRVSPSSRQIDYSAPYERPSIVNPDDHLATVVEVGHPNQRWQW